MLTSILDVGVKNHIIMESGMFATRGSNKIFSFLLYSHKRATVVSREDRRYRYRTDGCYTADTLRSDFQGLEGVEVMIRGADLTSFVYVVIARVETRYF